VPVSRSGRVCALHGWLVDPELRTLPISHYSFQLAFRWPSRPPRSPKD